MRSRFAIICLVGALVCACGDPAPVGQATVETLIGTTAVSTVETVTTTTDSPVEPDPGESADGLPVEPDAAGTCEELEELFFQFYQDFVDLADQVPFYYLSNYGFSYITPYFAWEARGMRFNTRFQELDCELSMEIILARVDELTWRSRSGEFVIQALQGETVLPMEPSTIDPVTARMQAGPEPAPPAPAPGMPVDPQSVETCQALDPLYVDHYQDLIDMADEVPVDVFEDGGLATLGRGLEAWETRLFFLEFREHELECPNSIAAAGAFQPGALTAKTATGELLIGYLQG